MRNKHIIYVLVSLVLSCVLIINIISWINMKHVLFHDYVEFKLLNVGKIEKFTLDKESNVHFIFDSKTEDGNVTVKIYNDDNKMFFKYSGNEYYEEIDRVLPKGTYNYEILIINGKNGYFKHKAIAIK